MYSVESYLWGWAAYSVGVLCLLGLFWLLIKKIASQWIRHLLLILFLVAFFTPVTAYPDTPYLAPAFFVSFYEGIFLSHKEMGFQRGLAPILAVGFIAIILYSLVLPILRRKRRSIAD
jgi:uncharacterized membrane protein YccC